jgi:predicted outer membrane protein
MPGMACSAGSKPIGEANLAEVQAGKLGQRKAHAEEVKKFARRMPRTRISRRWRKKRRPKIEKHLQMAKQLSDQASA